MSLKKKMMMVVVVVVVVMVMVGVVNSDITEDRNECADQLIVLAPCLVYVGGTGNRPTPDCCTGLKQVVQKSKKCLCILIKDRNEPSLGFKVNVTRTLTLPAFCHSPTNISDCPAILKLPPNSPEAKVFQDFANRLNNATTNPPPPPGSSATSTPASSASPDSNAAAADDTKKSLLICLTSLLLIPHFIIINYF